ncbi:MAG: phosphoribosylglycinamide formyltransferase [Lachnospiraceae bacterium]|nr:phosphoribosylglycinamide formyltransferase [Lachnospiraceae bacterium]MDY5743032.1 phosphoribosylglycinamide formyltransferase [Lachnospiraceae bacterium]
MLKIAVLVSGGGTNLQAIIDGIHAGTIRNSELALVISNNASAYALERAARAGIAHSVISPKQFSEREDFHQALLQSLREAGIDLVVLAGFLVNIPPCLVEAFPQRILNIHPSLIPSFCGKGYYGLHVHEAVLARGVKVSGATVHFVDNGCDTGPILLQKTVAVRPQDTAEQLQRRVMEEAEWQLLPAAIDAIATGRVKTDGQAVWVTEEKA